jgi:hypothetical protein
MTKKVQMIDNQLITYYNKVVEVATSTTFTRIPQSEIADSEIPLSQSSLKLDMTVRMRVNDSLSFLRRSPH